jgi:hypothetical protein
MCNFGIFKYLILDKTRVVSLEPDPNPAGRTLDPSNKKFRVQFQKRLKVDVP